MTLAPPSHSVANAPGVSADPLPSAACIGKSPEAIGFRPGRVALGQLGMVLGLSLLAWRLLPLFFGDQPTDRSVLAAGLLSLATGMVAILPVAILAKRGLMPMVYGYFIGASLRMILALAGVVWLVVGERYPAMVLVAAMMTIYPLSLLLEAGMVGRSLWSAKSR